MRVFVMFVTAILVLTSSAAKATGFFSNEDALFEKTIDLIRSDVESLSRLKFSKVSRAHMAFFGSSSGNALVEFIKKRTKRIEWTETDDLVIASASNGTLWISERYAELDQVHRWAVLIHESRHNESAGWNHVKCPNPYIFTFDEVSYRFPVFDEYSGTLGCDNTSDGAYGVEHAFLQSIFETCVNCTKEMKNEATKLMFSSGYLRIINSDAATKAFIDSNAKTLNIIEENHIFLRKAERILNKK